MTSTLTSAFVLIDKPAGITSFKSLGSIKKQFGTKRVGHAGTLDMSASGLIVAAFGKCTRLLPFIESQEKVYTFDLHLGYTTDTLEPTGNIIRDNRGHYDDDRRGRPMCLPNFDENFHQKLNEILNEFIGEIEQIPPIYSAIKIDGKRASDHALKGHEIELKPRKINIYELSIVWADPCVCPPALNNTTTIPIYCRCSKGTYIRSLARDIAEKLGTCGVAGNIRRLKIGNISVENASANPISPQQIFNWQIIEIDYENTKKILNGLPVAHQCENENLKFISNNNKIIAVAESQNGYLIPKFQL
jgi:tRNA pseudouridine55 synthase